jgi:polysaccharide biosynthesis protein PslH
MQQKPSILALVSYRVFPALMGGQKCIAAFYQVLQPLTNLKLVVSSDNDLSYAKDVDVSNYLYNHWKGIYNLRYFWRLKKTIDTHQIQHIIIEHSYFGWLGWLLRLFTKVELILRVHNIEAYRFRDMHRKWWSIYYFYERWICKSANQIWFTSPNDAEWMQIQWKIPKQQCCILNYGVDISSAPSSIEKKQFRNLLLEQYQLHPQTRLFLFNGTLDYIPNTDALRIIVSELLPRLDKLQKGYRIFICGNRITEQWRKELEKHPQIILAGFVPDIALYYKGTDCFINPVTLGSGVKTKLVEALAFNQDIISVISGAKGIEASYCGQKLQLIQDYDWDGFTNTMMQLELPSKHQTPNEFYQDFNWNHIVYKAILSLQP